MVDRLPPGSAELRSASSLLPCFPHSIFASPFAVPFPHWTLPSPSPIGCWTFSVRRSPSSSPSSLLAFLPRPCYLRLEGKATLSSRTASEIGMKLGPAITLPPVRPRMLHHEVEDREPAERARRPRSGRCPVLTFPMPGCARPRRERWHPAGILPTRCPLVHGLIEAGRDIPAGSWDIGPSVPIRARPIGAMRTRCRRGQGSTLHVSPLQGSGLGADIPRGALRFPWAPVSALHACKRGREESRCICPGTVRPCDQDGKEGSRVQLGDSRGDGVDCGHA